MKNFKYIPKSHVIFFMFHVLCTVIALKSGFIVWMAFNAFFSGFNLCICITDFINRPYIEFLKKANLRLTEEKLK